MYLTSVTFSVLLVFGTSGIYSSTFDSVPRLVPPLLPPEDFSALHSVLSLVSTFLLLFRSAYGQVSSLVCSTSASSFLTLAVLCLDFFFSDETPTLIVGSEVLSEGFSEASKVYLRKFDSVIIYPDMKRG